jgi:hypothetical protein
LTSGKNLWEIESVIKSEAGYEFRLAGIIDTYNSSENDSKEKQFHTLHILVVNGNVQA